MFREFTPNTAFERDAAEAVDYILCKSSVFESPLPPPSLPHTTPYPGTTRTKLSSAGTNLPSVAFLKSAKRDENNPRGRPQSTKSQIKSEQLTNLLHAETAGGVTEPQICSFMDKHRRVGGEFSTSLLSKMFADCLSFSEKNSSLTSHPTGGAMAAISSNDIARAVQGSSPFVSDWKLLVDFLLNHKEEQNGIKEKRQSTTPYRPKDVSGRVNRTTLGLGRRIKSSIVTPGTLDSKPTMSDTLMTSLGRNPASEPSPSPRRESTRRQVSVQNAGSIGASVAFKLASARGDILDYIPFKESRHPSWSVHVDSEELKGKKKDSLLGVNSNHSLTRRETLGVLTTMNSATIKANIKGLDGNSIVCCKANNKGLHTPGESLAELTSASSNTHVRAVVVDLSRVHQMKGAHFEPTVSSKGLSVGSHLPDCWAAPSTNTQKPPPRRTAAQTAALNSIVSYIER